MKAAEAKKRLIEESVRLIAEQGLNGLSFREMARRAGLSHQAPYHHFANREGILAAIALEGFTNLDAAVVTARTINRGKPPQKILQAVLAGYVTFAMEYQVHFRVMFRPELVPVRRYPALRKEARLSFDRLVDTIRECHRGENLGERRLLEIANALWAAAHGLATLWLDGPMRSNTPGLSLPSLLAVATEIFSEAGTRAYPAAHKRSDRLSAASTASSRTT